MRLVNELRSAGYGGTPTDFKELLIDVFRHDFANWTADDLLCNPRDALRYCDLVRSISECQSLSDYVILKTLLNVRKQAKSPPKDSPE